MSGALPAFEPRAASAFLGLTLSQRETLWAIQRHQATFQGRSPSLQELACALDLATRGSAKQRIDTLVARGVLQRTGRRGLRIMVDTGFHYVAAEPIVAGMPVAYTGPYPIRTGVTCADFDGDGLLLKGGA